MLNSDKKKRRAAIFIDGSNLYMNFKDVGITKGNLDYGLFSEKLILDREWMGTFFYVAPVRGGDRASMARNQQRFFSKLHTTKNVNLKLGVLEERYETCAACKKTTRFMIQKGVDVLLAVDMIAKAMKDEYDHGYLVSADADFVPLVEYLRFVLKKKVFCVSPKGSQYGKLSNACDASIPISQEFVDACQAV